MREVNKRVGTTRDLLGRIRRRFEVAMYGSRRVRVVVVGHQKSGTTAVGALLARGMKGDFANDPLYSMDWGQGKAAQALLNGTTELSSMVRAKPSLFCSNVLKDPDLTFQLRECVRVFPQARVVFVVRDPRDTIRSIADRLSLTAEDLSRPTAPGRNVNRHWQLILDGQLPVVEGTSVVERLARRWKLAWARCLECSDPLAVLRYEDFVANKATVVQDLIRKLGFRVEADVEAYVDVAYQPRGRASVDLCDRLGKQNLETIEKECAAEMAGLGYTIARVPRP